LEEGSGELSSQSSPNSSLSMQRVVPPDEMMTSSALTAESTAEVIVERDRLLESGETQSDL